MSEQQVMFVNKPLVPCAIFDLDGTLSDHFWRIPMIGPRVEGQNPQKRFDKYHSNCHIDQPISKIVACLKKHHIDHHIAICTGRPVKYKKITEQWLNRWEIPYKILMMRDNKDYNHGWKLKLGMIQQLPKLGFLPKMIYDDEPEIIAMAKDLGLKTFQMKGKSWKL